MEEVKPCALISSAPPTPGVGREGRVPAQALFLLVELDWDRLTPEIREAHSFPPPGTVAFNVLRWCAFVPGWPIWRAQERIEVESQGLSAVAIYNGRQAGHVSRQRRRKWVSTALFLGQAKHVPRIASPRS